nr:PREDICTED: serine/threonine-protein kinase fray2-like [Daucus carota subsp. sativus]
MAEPEKRFPLNAQDYVLYEEVGEGVSATVFRALCVLFDEIVAIKVLDLEKWNNDLVTSMDGIHREVQTMTSINHPNLIWAHCSFTSGHNLWVVMTYMVRGSCLHIMKSAFPEGLEEPVIATLLREVLKALVYFHAHGHIHRDVKGQRIHAFVPTKCAEEIHNQITFGRVFSIKHFAVQLYSP